MKISFIFLFLAKEKVYKNGGDKKERTLEELIKMNDRFILDVMITNDIKENKMTPEQKPKSSNEC